MSSSERRWWPLAGGLALAFALLFGRRAQAPMLSSAPDTPLPTPDMRRTALLAEVRRGEPGSGGYYGTWPADTGDGAVARHIEFQYAGMEHQSGTALSGMWLFLASELLFFGGLFLVYMVYRGLYSHAFATASRHTELAFGTVNSVLLLTSSAVFTWGLGHVRRGDNRRLFRACIVVAVLGLAFLGLKAWEWTDDLHKNLFPGEDFAIGGMDGHGAQLFWCFYWVATMLHGVHMIIGVALVGWLGWSARQGRYSPGYYTPAEVVGLYWSFVDMVWLCLYPMIYLAGGVTR